VYVTNKQQETLMFRQIRTSRRGARFRGIALFAALAWVCSASGKPAPATFGGVVSIADGEPFTLVRGTSVNTATKGVMLAAGDIIATGPGAFLAVEMQGGNLVGIGPNTQLYLMQRSGTDSPTLVVLKGWVKADIRSGPKGLPLRLTGTRLGIQSHQAVVLLYVDDPLPENASSKLKKNPPPQFVREVNYSDVQQWLNMPRDWRAGFIPRFRGRLKDPAFFAAMDASMAQHPEWQPILHPPPPPEEDARLPPQPTTH